MHKQWQPVDYPASKHHLRTKNRDEPASRLIWSSFSRESSYFGHKVHLTHLEPGTPTTTSTVRQSIRGNRLKTAETERTVLRSCTIKNQPQMLWCPALTLTMRTHLMRDRPKPEMAPYRPAADVVRQNDKKKPIQLKRNATGEKKNIQDLVRQEESLLTHLHPEEYKWGMENIIQSNCGMFPGGKNYRIWI